MSNAKFEKKINLRADEQIALILHHHPIGYVKQICISIFIILLSFFLMYALINNLAQLGLALFIALLLTGVVYAGREFYIWFHNVFIVTNQRIIDIDQRGFFEKIVSEAPFEKISDISYSVHGFWQTILKLGTIKIKAAGVDLIIFNIKTPGKINQILVDSIRKDTGKNLEVKQTNNISDGAKKKLTEDFLQQDKLAEYEDYNLDELLAEYKDTFGELSLKKLLVEELEKDDKKANEEDENKIKFTRR